MDSIECMNADLLQCDRSLLCSTSKMEATPRFVEACLPKISASVPYSIPSDVIILSRRIANGV